MKTLRLLLSLVAMLAGMPVLQAQVVTTDPVFFQDTTPITLTFDATKGNGALAGFTGPVYIWTGVITERSTNDTDWKYVKSPSFNQADPAAQLTRSTTNPNLYTLSFTPRAFYGVPATERMLKLAMIFKNADGSVVGRGDGGDILVNVSQSALDARITSPTTAQFVPAGTQVPVSGLASASAQLTFRLNGVQVAQQTGTSLSTTVTVNQVGRNVVRFTATNGTLTASDSVLVVVSPQVTVAALPAGAKKDGITYINGGASAILSLTAPGKSFVYVLGEFNNWQQTTVGFMKKTPETDAANARWWVQIDNLTPGQEYAYQYEVNGILRVADPYAEKVLDPSNDRFIPAVTYPSLKPYPTGQTTGIVSVLQSNQAPYQWQVNNFQRPKRTDLVVYELHLRDFIARHDYATLQDTLTYLKRLGVNCIELMPVNEFEGNDSWGYNPSFYFAPDKYYGTKDALKTFIDEAHRRGIAVVLDIVLNHSCGQSPMVQMYFDGGNPSTDSPWFNRTATHPFNVCYDFNHESPFTKYFSKQVIAYWLQEYRVDGYRFDLSKGFTQRVTTDDSQMRLYDQSRINTLLDYHSTMTAISPTLYPILEHFAENSEEKVLADAGMMLWGNNHGAYTAAMKGESANFTGVSHLSRQFNEPNLVSYMESHDEERLIVSTLAEGNIFNPAYNIRTLPVALARAEMAAAFFLTIPGPKMIWQFGELGYDVGINVNGRTGQKPIRWNYQTEPARRQLYNVYAALNALKVNEPAFESRDVAIVGTRGPKSIRITDPSMNVVVIGNFGVLPDSVQPGFQGTGKWYNYLRGDSIQVTNVTARVAVQPGEYAVYTSRRVKLPAAIVLSNKPRRATTADLRLSAAPNPVATTATLYYTLTAAAPVTVTVTNVLGAKAQLPVVAGRQSSGPHELQLPVSGLANGVYMVRLQAGDQQQTVRLLVQQ
ncbi:alpha-amylase family glycosyl hydrolase [Hymenobacter canadensis]|uniref:Alpha-amylase family glycosyl hydrolase n=1 Tax=Hymenobacter canadensis TaxID=2999067 RepID=A0ABY7LRT0_9BACT|nr:alpha-amylase family glycosyl hydrolase [Hymenobacter canadensis]WBA42554.1 alpha-amylase family glycosyl hydrolase [Hymenobacter canadensis]